MSLHGWVLTHLTGVLKEEDPDAHAQERPGKDTESAHRLHTQDSGLWENAPVYFHGGTSMSFSINLHHFIIGTNSAQERAPISPFSCQYLLFSIFFFLFIVAALMGVR